MRWSAIQAHQIDGRSHRDGKFAQVYWTVARETIDIRVAEVLLRKLESMSNLQGDPVTDFEEIFNSIQEGDEGPQDRSAETRRELSQN